MKIFGLFLAALMAYTVPLSAAENVTITVLHSSDSFISQVTSTTGSVQAGSVYFDTYHASIWNGSAASFQDLHPINASYSFIFSTIGTQHAGYAFIGGTYHAAIWDGPAAIFKDLHPSAADSSYLNSTTGLQQAGFVVLNNTITTHAAIWSGSKESFQDVHPIGAGSSNIYSIGGSQLAGYAGFGNHVYAAIWNGPDHSFKNLNPDAASDSFISSTTGLQQAGGAYVGNAYHAAIWAGSKESFQDLHPTDTSESYIYSTTGARQAGYAKIGDLRHAGIWADSAESFVDLHAFLPMGYSESVANSIWADGSTIFVAGYAIKTGQTVYMKEAVLWTLTPDNSVEPGDIPLPTPTPETTPTPLPEVPPVTTKPTPTPVVTRPIVSRLPPAVEINLIDVPMALSQGVKAKENGSVDIYIGKTTDAEPSLLLKGKATGRVTSVTYCFTKHLPSKKKLSRFSHKSDQRALGKKSWQIKVRLTTYRKYILITAHGPDGDSLPAIATIHRRSFSQRNIQDD